MNNSFFKELRDITPTVLIQRLVVYRLGYQSYKKIKLYYVVIEILKIQLLHVNLDYV